MSQTTLKTQAFVIALSCSQALIIKGLLVETGSFITEHRHPDGAEWGPLFQLASAYRITVVLWAAGGESSLGFSPSTVRVCYIILAT